MNEQISRLEAQLERLIEGAFAQFFGKSVRPQDIALRLSRAMEDSLQLGTDGDVRPFAPDHYVIHLNTTVRDQLLARQPALAHILSQHMIELANYADCRLRNIPLIDLVGDPLLAPTELTINAFHLDTGQNNTAVMDKIEPRLPTNDVITAPRNPQIILNGERVISLEKPILNIGRSRDNDLVLDDLFVSRHHIQLRLRFGHYTLFDTNSQSGTRVNDVIVREHRLQSGDVIRIGKTQIVYLEDDPLGDGQTNAVITLDS